MNTDSLINTDKINEQIEYQMYKAFCDIIDEGINSGNPDCNFLVELYKEFRDRLICLVKKDGKTYKRINDSFDVELFKQMIENNVFNEESIIKLVDNVFIWIETLQAPIRDEETKKSKEKIFKDKTKIISTFVIEAHKCIDNIYTDIKFYNENKNF